MFIFSFILVQIADFHAIEGYRRIIYINKYLTCFDMTQVFISALSTTRIDLNQQDRQFYCFEKKKEIQDVRSCLSYLVSFNQATPKERMQMDLKLVWKSMQFVATILGYDAEFNKIAKLRLPPHILLEQLFFVETLFSFRPYRSYQIIQRWQGLCENYYVLLSGVVQKQLLRNSIFKLNYELVSTSHGNQGLHHSYTKKQAKKKYVRNDDQIPICINSRRNELRMAQSNSGLYRAVTSAQLFSVNYQTWKKYVSSFKKMQEDYILNFIRRKLNMNFNIEALTPSPATGVPVVSNQETKEQTKSAEFYSIDLVQKKSSLQLTNCSLFLLYEGQVLVTSQNYKIESSQGCVLNSELYKTLRGQEKINDSLLLGKALAKVDSVIIKLDVERLFEYFQKNHDDWNALCMLLQNLEMSRRAKIDSRSLDKMLSKSCSQTLSLPKKEGQIRQQMRSSVGRIFQASAKKTVFLPNCKGARLKTEQNEPNQRYKSPPQLFACKQIQNRVDKQDKIMQLIANESQKKKDRLSEPLNHPGNRILTVSEMAQFQEYSILNSVVLKDCMSCIVARGQMLKKSVIEHRKRRQKAGIFEPVDMNATDKRSRQVRQSSTEVLKRKIKAMYIRTQEDEPDTRFYLQTISNRLKKPIEHTRDSFQNKPDIFNILSKEENRQVCFRNGQYMPGGRGVIKKVQKGQLRRVKEK